MFTNISNQKIYQNHDLPELIGEKKDLATKNRDILLKDLFQIQHYNPSYNNFCDQIILFYSFTFVGTEFWLSCDRICAYGLIGLYQLLNHGKYPFLILNHFYQGKITPIHVLSIDYLNLIQMNELADRKSVIDTDIDRKFVKFTKSPSGIKNACLGHELLNQELQDLQFQQDTVICPLRLLLDINPPQDKNITIRAAVVTVFDDGSRTGIIRLDPIPNLATIPDRL